MRTPRNVLRRATPIYGSRGERGKVRAVETLNNSIIHAVFCALFCVDATIVFRRN